MDFNFRSYDIKHRLLQAETSSLYHKNDTHIGDRYCIVLFNKNLNYANSTYCKRSISIQLQPYIKTHYLEVFDNEQLDAIRSELLDILHNTTFQKDRCTINKKQIGHSKYGFDTGEFLSFGVTASRKSRTLRHEAGLLTRQSENTNNKKHAYLYNCFCKYINAMHPNIFGKSSIYSSCIIAKNSQCLWHRDKHNIGSACLSALGNYTQGDLLLEHKESEHHIEHTNDNNDNNE